MKNYKAILVFISSMLFGNLAFSVEGIAVIDYNAIFLGTELARERIDDLRDSSDYKELTDEAQSKDSERIKLAGRLKKEESTLSDTERADILKKVLTIRKLSNKKFSIFFSSKSFLSSKIFPKLSFLIKSSSIMSDGSSK